MARKLLSTRAALMTAVSLPTGSAIGVAAETAAAHAGYPTRGVGQVATAIAIIWTLDKLNNLIDDAK